MTDLSLVAGVVPARQPWTGAPLADTFQGLVAAIDGRSWVDGLSAGVDLAATAIDPFGALLASGLGWAMEYFAPLRQILDELTGLPDVVASQAATWENMAAELAAMAGDLRAHVQADLPDWQGAAADAYGSMMTGNLEALGGLAAVAAAMASATAAAGALVQFTRDIVRDLIADLVGRVIVWAAEAVFVVTVPVIAEQIVAAVVKWAARILGYTTALVSSLTNLTRLVGG